MGERLGGGWRKYWREWHTAHPWSQDGIVNYAPVMLVWGKVAVPVHEVVLARLERVVENEIIARRRTDR